ncbi:MAG TPA: hypothetical protein VFT48_14110 [Pyrinomonadaceae bacterium]|nr:hypothetical protein [Pyrinomonadaceae bacterium]
MLYTHKRLLKTLVGVCIVALLSPVLALAQDGITTQKLREQIAAMEKVDKDQSTLEETRDLNRNLLAGKRAELAERLTKEIDGLQKYSQTMESSLSASDKEKIATRISSLRQEREALQRPVTTASAVPTLTVQPKINSNSTATATDSVGNTSPQNVSNHPGANAGASASAQQVFVSTCFPDAPNNLTNTARAAAELFVTNDDASSQLGDLTFYAIIHTVATDAGREDLLKAIEVKQLQEQTRRTDKQIGAGANSEGSTSALEKPSFAEILGLAVEHGAIQQAINGTTLNLSTTPYLFTTLANGDTQSNYKKYGYLTRLGASANFSIQDEDNPLASARRQQLNNWSLRLRLSKDRSTRSDDVEEIWDSVKDDFAQQSVVITRFLRDTFQRDLELETRRRDIGDRLLKMLDEPSSKAIHDDTNLTDNQKISQIAEKIVCRVKTDLVDSIRSGSFKLSQENKDRIISQTLPDFAAANAAKARALRLFDERIEALSLKPIFTLAYNNIKPTIGSNYSELKVLYQKKMFDPISVIANGGVSFYHQENPVLRQKTVRDFSVGLSLEGTAGRSPFMLESKDDSQITYSFTGRYERFFENQYFAGRKADIAVAQFKFEIPMAAGVSFPFSVTYANSSELIKEDKVRANFGFTFDTDKLLKALALSKLP